MKTDNRRRNSRVPFRATITLQFADNKYEECETRDLSMRGVFVAGVTGRKIGDQCDVALHLSGATSDLSLKMKGEVVRAHENGLALHFFETDLDSFYHLKNILYYNSENPDNLDEEFSDKILDFQSID